MGIILQRLSCHGHKDYPYKMSTYLLCTLSSNWITKTKPYIFEILHLYVRIKGSVCTNMITNVSERSYSSELPKSLHAASRAASELLLFQILSRPHPTQADLKTGRCSIARLHFLSDANKFGLANNTLYWENARGDRKIKRKGGIS